VKQAPTHPRGMVWFDFIMHYAFLVWLVVGGVFVLPQLVWGLWKEWREDRD
jgi:hypothetical protein